MHADWNASIYTPLNPRWAACPIFPAAWRRILRGERRTYETALSRAECVAKLTAVVMPASSGRSDSAMAVGAVDYDGFRGVRQGGIAGEQGMVPILYGRFENHGSGTRNHVVDTVPRIIGVGVYAFTLVPILAIMLLLGSWLAGNADTGFAAAVIAYAVTTIFIVIGWMVMIGRDLKRPRFAVVAEALEAKRLMSPDQFVGDH